MRIKGNGLILLTHKGCYGTGNARLPGGPTQARRRVYQGTPYRTAAATRM